VATPLDLNRSATFFLQDDGPPPAFLQFRVEVRDANSTPQPLGIEFTAIPGVDIRRVKTTSCAAVIAY